MQNQSEENIKHALIVLHGAKEHIGRYSDVMSQIRRTGIPVVGDDLSSHGSNMEGEKHNFTFEQMLESALSIIDKAKEEFPNHRHIILGHGMGSSIVRYITYSNLRDFDGVILSGLSYPKKTSLNFLLLLNMFGKKEESSKLGDGLNSFITTRKSKRRGYGKEWLSTDEDNIKYYEADNLCGHPLTGRSISAMHKFTKKATSKHLLSKFKNKNIPQLLIYGTRDPICNFGQDIERLIAIQNKKKINNHYTKAYFGSRHEVLFDKSKEEAVSEIIDFIETRC